MNAPPGQQLLDEIATDQLELQRLLGDLVSEIRAGRRQLRFLSVIVAIGALAAVILVLILLAGFEITTQPAALLP